MELFKLLGTIAVSNEEANSAIDETSEKASAFGEKLKSGIGTAAKWGTAIAGGATVAAGAVMKFATGSAATADNIDKMSQKIGISREAYQEFDFICSQSGTSVDGLQMGLRTLTAQMDKVSEGNKAATERFEKLGVAVTNADGTFRSQEDVLFDTLSALQNIENQTEKSRLATELFGRSGTELMPLLNGAAGSIESMKNQAHDLGLVLSDDVIDSGVEMTDTMDQLKRSFASVATKLGASLMPVVKNVAKFLIDNMPKIQEIFTRLEPAIMLLINGVIPPLLDIVTEILPLIMDLVVQLMPFIVQVVEMVLPILVELLQAILPVLMELISAAMPVLLSLLQAIMPIIQILLDLLSPLISLLAAIITPIINAISQALQPMLSVLTQIISFLTDKFQPVFNVVFGVVGSYVKSLADGISKQIGFIKGGFEGVIDFVKNVFSGNWKGAWEAVVKIFDNIFGGIVNMAKIPLNAMISGLNAFISGLNKIQVPDWVPGVGGMGINIPQIPKLAKGGKINASGGAIVGEDGAEFINLPSGATVTPLNDNNNALAGLKAAQEETNRLLRMLLEKSGDVIMNENAVGRVLSPIISKQIAWGD